MSQHVWASTGLALWALTVSSGEALAVAFEGRPRTRFFGERTRGLASANQGYPLSDGAVIHLTTALDRDRNGVEYPHGIEPDERLPIGDSVPPEFEDPAMQAAQRWLRVLR